MNQAEIPKTFLSGKVTAVRGDITAQEVEDQSGACPTPPKFAVWNRIER
jgi:hypothetical protein